MEGTLFLLNFLKYIIGFFTLAIVIFYFYIMFKTNKNSKELVDACTEKTIGKISDIILFRKGYWSRYGYHESLYDVFCEYQVNGVMYQGKALFRYKESEIKKFDNSNIEICYNPFDPKQFCIGYDSAKKYRSNSMASIILLFFVICITVLTFILSFSRIFD